MQARRSNSSDWMRMLGQHHAVLAAECGSLLCPAVLESLKDATMARPITLPIGISIFPCDHHTNPRAWAERYFTNIIHWNEPAQGGHFAAGNSQLSSWRRSGTASAPCAEL